MFHFAAEDADEHAVFGDLIDSVDAFGDGFCIDEVACGEEDAVVFAALDGFFAWDPLAIVFVEAFGALFGGEGFAFGAFFIAFGDVLAFAFLEFFGFGLHIFGEGGEFGAGDPFGVVSDVLGVEFWHNREFSG